MRTSEFPLSTTKEIPADAEIISHRLMLRSGMIRKVSSGLYTWMPLGLRSLRKVENIVRQEMDAAGAIELLMPAVQPADLWKQSKRWNDYGPELLRIQDRHGRDFVYGPTHEEIITNMACRELHSYKQLPINYYQIQTKFRDEIRPRFGVMRAREFLMKDAYSFHLDQDSLEQTYQQMYQTYHRIFERLQLDFLTVLADTGTIGGSKSHEFHVLAETGEDAIAFSSNGTYAANVELAPTPAVVGDRPSASAAMTLIDTPGIKTIDALCRANNFSPQHCIKALFVKGTKDDLLAVFVRGDHTLNVTKAQKHPSIAAPLEFVEEAQIVEAVGCHPGSLGPVNLNVPVLADYAAAAAADFVCGANRDGAHYINANWGRDAPEPETADLRNIEENDPSPDGNGVITIKRGIEVGHIFQLGKKYSTLMKAEVLNEAGESQTMTMGCYGIGISRIVAAAIEQSHDDLGIIWPLPLAPFELHLAPIQYHQSETVRKACDRLHSELEHAGIEVLLDDRDIRAGAMFADTDLIGIPYRLVVGDRNLRENKVECKERTKKESSWVALDSCVQYLATKIHQAGK